MKNVVKQIKWQSVIRALLLIVMGIALIVKKDFAMLTICTIVGIMLIVGGVASIITYMVGTRRVFGAGELVLGIIELALGIFITVRPTAVTSFLGLLFAAILILHGIGNIVETRLGKRYGDERWLVSGCLGLVSVMLGFLILWNPFSSATILIIIVGVALIYAGVVDLLVLFRVRKFSRTYQSYLDDEDDNIIDM